MRLSSISGERGHKTAKSFLGEMSLKSYQHDLIPRPEAKEEFFTNTTTGEKDLGYQIDTSGSMAKGGGWSMDGMPLGGVSPDGYYQIKGRFSQKDRIIITHPKTLRRLEEKLSRSEFDFNILMLEDRGLDNGDVIDHAKTHYEDRVHEFIESNRIETRGHITFVKNGSSGHLLTPWMILHTLGHALTEEEPKNQPGLKDNIVLALQQIVYGNRFLATGYVPYSEKWSFPVDSVSYVNNHGSYLKDRKQMIRNMFHFKSASLEGRHDVTGNDIELVHELIAEFLWHGDKIRIKSPYDDVPYVVTNIKYIEDEIRGLLRSCVGKVIYDYFI